MDRRELLKLSPLALASTVGHVALGQTPTETHATEAIFNVRAFGAVSVLLLVAALLACVFPAWRASRVEPLEALRYE